MNRAFWGAAAAALGLGFFASHPPDSRQADGSASRHGVSFIVTDELMLGDVKDRVTVMLDGRSVGTLRVDEAHPRADLRVDGFRAGPHRYAVSSETTMISPRHRPLVFRYSGSGTLNVKDGGHYDFCLCSEEQPRHLVLSEAD